MLSCTGALVRPHDLPSAGSNIARLIRAFVHYALLALTLLCLQPAAHAQSVPFPDMSEQLASCSGIIPGSYCKVQPMQYIDKAPASTACPAYPCAGGPGRYQEIRIINPPDYTYPYFVWTAVFVPDDVIIEINGPSYTKALPAGPILPQTITTRQGRYPYPRASVGYKLDNAGFQWFATCERLSESA